MTVVLDASALLAYLQEEAGADLVKDAFGEAAISTVNWAEVVQKVLLSAGDAAELRLGLQALGLAFVPLSVAQAEVAGQLREATAPFGLSLGDRACLAAAVDLDATVYTADRVWQQLALDVPVRLIR